MIRIYHCDPYPIYSKGLADTLSKFPEIEWLGSQNGYIGLLENLLANKADILISNNYLYNGAIKVEMHERLPEIRVAFPGLKIVILTMASSLEMQRLFKKGGLIEAFIPKSSVAEEIYKVIKLIKNGDTWWFYTNSEEKC